MYAAPVCGFVVGKLSIVPFQFKYEDVDCTLFGIAQTEFCALKADRLLNKQADKKKIFLFE